MLAFKIFVFFTVCLLNSQEIFSSSNKQDYFDNHVKNLNKRRKRDTFDVGTFPDEAAALISNFSYTIKDLPDGDYPRSKECKFIN